MIGIEGQCVLVWDGVAIVVGSLAHTRSIPCQSWEEMVGILVW